MKAPLPKISARSLLSAFAVAALLLSMSGLYMVRPDAGGTIPAFAEVRAAHKSSDARLYDRHGELIHELRVSFDERKAGWVSIADVSPALLRAVIMSEDRRFYDHRGADWTALTVSAAGNIMKGGHRGASTLTMQLVSRILPGMRPQNGRRGIYEKLAQIRAARALEAVWSKDEIMEAYINLVSFRGELTGISAASRGLFDKEPAGLDFAESVVLASLIRAPNAEAGDIYRRASGLASTLGEDSREPDIRAAVALATGEYRIRARASIAPHVARALLGKDRMEAVTTLDGGLQRFAVELVGRYMAQVKGSNVGDCALLVVDNKTGDALAYVGNSGDSSTALYVDGVRAKRQAGSTLKPFLYALAFERRLLTPASLLDDSPIDVPTGMGTYSPGNYDNTYRGMVSARVALASSLNIPAVRTLSLMGEEPFKRRLGEHGIGGLLDGDYYGLSLALGTAEVSLWELVGAYRTLANGGLYSGLWITPGADTACRRVCAEEAAFLVSDILSDRAARSTTFGLENPLSTRFWSAVKTGTSKDMRDNWCVGYSSLYTVGVWVGNFSGEPMWNVSGITGAAPIWYELMERLHGEETSGPPVPPAGVVCSLVSFPDTGTRRMEWFVRGTEPTTVRLADAAPVCRILYPPPDTIIAHDPDIPTEMQRVFFERTYGEAAWYMDGEFIGDGETLSWSPRTGSHRLVLTDSDSRVLDSLDFRVR